MSNNRKIPIERLNKFFSADDFELEIDFGREWLADRDWETNNYIYNYARY